MTSGRSLLFCLPMTAAVAEAVGDVRAAAAALPTADGDRQHSVRYFHLPFGDSELD